MNLSEKKRQWIIRGIAALLIVAGVVIRPIVYVTVLYLLFVVLFERDTDEVFALLFFLMPFATIFKITASSTSMFTYVQLAFIGRLIFQKKFDGKFLIIWMVYAIYLFIGMGNAVSDYIKQLVNPMMIYFALCGKKKKSTVLQYIEPYIVGVLIASVVGLMKDILPNLSVFLRYKETRLSMDSYETTVRFSGLWGDPNYYTVNLILVLALNMCLYINNHFSLVKMVGYCGAVMIFGALTGSKTFLLIAAFAYVWLMIELYRNKKIWAGIVCTGGIIIVVVLIIMGRITMFDMVIQRLMTATTLNELTTNRSGILKQYLSLYVENPLKAIIGNGLGKGFTYGAPHNTYIDLIELYGIVGTGLLMSQILIICGKLKRCRIGKGNLINSVPLILLMILYATLSMLLYLDTSFQLILAIGIRYENQSNDMKKIA